MFSSFKNYILVLFGSIQEQWKSRSKCDVQINNLSYLQLNITDGYLELSLPRLTCSTLLKLPAHFQNRHIHTECALEVLLSKISGNLFHPAHEKLCYITSESCFKIHCMMPVYHKQSFPVIRVHSIKLRLLFNTIETGGR